MVSINDTSGSKTILIGVMRITYEYVRNREKLICTNHSVHFIEKIGHNVSHEVREGVCGSDTDWNNRDFSLKTAHD